MMSLKGARWLSALAGILGALAAHPEPADAANRMCAFRSGPKGPCTCKTDGDGPGQFSTVARSICERRQPATQKRKEKAAPAAAPAPAPVPVQPKADTAVHQPASQAKDAAPAPPPLPPVEVRTGPSVPAARKPETPPAVAPPAQAQVDAPPPAPRLAPITGSLPAQRKLEAVKARGKLLCGVNPGLLGFSYRTSSGEWAGLDADFCRAVAAAVLGDAGKVEFVPLDAAARFDALKRGAIDLLSRNTTWTMGRDVDMGLEFGGVLYFDGQSFITSEERGLVSAQQLSGTKVCVQSATTTEKNMAYYFGAHRIAAETQTFGSRDELLKAYRNGDCDAYSADRSSLFADRATFEDPAKHAILPEVISKEPLGPAVLQGDAQWTKIVRWTLAGLINAEEVGLERATAAAQTPLEGDALRLVEGAGASGEVLGLDKAWLRRVVAAVGNYGEMFETNVGTTSPLGMNRGINALWKKGGILFAPPMW